MLIWTIGHLLAVCIGISLGLLGGGGSVLALPILVYVMGIAPKSAIAMTLVIVGSVSLLGVIPHWRRGNINLKKAYIFGSATMLGAFIGAKIAVLPIVTETFQMALFAMMMLLMAVFMILRNSQSKNQPQKEKPKPIPSPQTVHKYSWLWLTVEGVGVGILTGLIGVGGGFAIVPALVLLGNTPMKEAIGTSLLIIALNAVAGLIGYLGHVSFDTFLTVSFTLAASLGTLLGAYLAQFVSAQQLQKSFGYFLLAVAAFVLFQNQSGFHKSERTSSKAIQHTSTTIKQPITCSTRRLG
ncbi:sulfite exporter TauE/SafE family protein [Planktothrix sp. FACHB-1355]|uniref:Probable membrane transporter protein n=1 Tax=Aerosakkonema funiforme FACHB-1375 TaxID=2949571 RepID=A0A926ZEU2_9CYAN|nr:MULTISPECIES: sulfite exporter TauE/SafE family protein [Oscillatoriales]MBD2179994.1 sulfite exporter TauE/SafE family protein [Aerosakkonema funiforme FACHB-1375]MBD3559856.1 sulfite exporter TauE/SafE family protein [Planktothrix sp. FACHB-1355]